MLATQILRSFWRSISSKVSKKAGFLVSLNSSSNNFYFSSKSSKLEKILRTNPETPKKCVKIRDDQNELLETLRNNLPFLKNTIRGKGINASTFFLEAFTSIKYPDFEIF